MSTLTIGKRLIPVEEIALVEDLDHIQLAKIQSERAFQSRVVLIDRESILSEQSVKAFVESFGFRTLATDAVATNPAIRFAVETFEAADGFSPRRPYRTRLVWRDQEGTPQSKLLCANPQTVLAVVVRGLAPDAPAEDGVLAVKESGSVKRRRTSRPKAKHPEPA